MAKQSAIEQDGTIVESLSNAMNHEYERLRANVIPPFWNVVYLGNSPSKRK